MTHELNIFPHRNRALILDDDIERLKEEISAQMVKNFENSFQEVNELIDAAEKEVRKTGFCEMFLDGKVRRLKLDEYIVWNDEFQRDKKRKIKASHLFFRKRLKQNSLSIINDYLSELILRVGLGGFPIDMSL